MLSLCAGKDIKKRKLPSIPKGIKNNKSTKLNKKKDDEAPSRKESVNSSEQQLGEEKSEGKEKQQGGRIISFTENKKSRMCVLNFPFSNSISFLLHFQASEGHTPVETKSEDVTDEGTKTRGERNDSKRKTEDGRVTDICGDEEDMGQIGRLLDEEKPSPQTEGSGGCAECEKNNGSVEEGRDMNTAAHSELPLQREEDRGAQENKKPSIITGENRKSAALKRRNARAASSQPEELLQKWNLQHLDKKRHLKVPKETGKEEIVSKRKIKIFAVPPNLTHNLAHLMEHFLNPLELSNISI